MKFALAIALTVALATGASAAEINRQIPAAAYDPPNTAATEKAVFAGGCFWGIQGVFQHVKGVTSAVSGYSGGTKETATYNQVITETTGHAEAVEVTFDPRQVSYAALLRIFFSVAHDPTEVNRQGPDTGPSYRTALFPLAPRQEKVARDYIAQLDRAKLFPRAIATRVEAFKGFFAAEDYHQDYLYNNPSQPYIVINDQPKLRNLAKVWPDHWRSQPVLVRNHLSGK